MTLPLNSIAMFVGMCACGVLAYVVWTAGSGWFSFPSLVQDAIGWLCIGGAFIFLAMTVAAIYDDLVATTEEE